MPLVVLILGTNLFDVGFFVKKGRSVSFVAGQPLGYHSSWLSLSHHLLVWYAAEQCYPGERITRYALLGDDIVIADDRVAHVYTQFLDELGHIVFEIFGFEDRGWRVCKAFRVNRLTKDLSPLSAAKILSTSAYLDWYNFCCTLQVPVRFTPFRK